MMIRFTGEITITGRARRSIISDWAGVNLIIRSASLDVNLAGVAIIERAAGVSATPPRVNIIIYMSCRRVHMCLRSGK